MRVSAPGKKFPFSAKLTLLLSHVDHVVHSHGAVTIPLKSIDSPQHHLDAVILHDFTFASWENSFAVHSRLMSCLTKFILKELYAD